jgi:hypothetical protein
VLRTRLGNTDAIARQDILQFPVVPFRPDLAAVRDINQLHGIAQALAGLSDAALNQKPDPNRFSCLCRIHPMTLEHKGGVSCLYMQIAMAAQLGHDITRLAVREKLLFAIRAEGPKGQHRDGCLPGNPKRNRVP